MKRDELQGMIQKILADIEEEEIGISLLSRHYQNTEELAFFKEEDRRKVFQILEKLSLDSDRHKRMLLELVDFLGEKLHGSSVS